MQVGSESLGYIEKDSVCERLHITSVVLLEEHAEAETT